MQDISRCGILSQVQLFGLLALCVLCSPNTLPAACKQDCIPTRKPQMLKQREQQLLGTAEKLLQAFRTGDTEAFLKLVHEKYFGVGEGKLYTLAELKEFFRTKDAMYCFLFDSSCIPPMSIDKSVKFLSFSELAKRPGARVKYVEVWTVNGVEGCRGHVSLVWPEQPGEKFVINVSRFTFMYEGGQWKTVGFDDLVPEPEKK